MDIATLNLEELSNLIGKETIFETKKGWWVRVYLDPNNKNKFIEGQNRTPKLVVPDVEVLLIETWEGVKGTQEQKNKVKANTLVSYEIRRKVNSPVTPPPIPTPIPTPLPETPTKHINPKGTPLTGEDWNKLSPGDYYLTDNLVAKQTLRIPERVHINLNRFTVEVEAAVFKDRKYFDVHGKQLFTTIAIEGQDSSLSNGKVKTLPRLKAITVERTNNIIVENVSADRDSGHFIHIDRSSLVSIIGCSASRLTDYFAFVTRSKHIQFDGCKVTEGSTEESIFRVHDCQNLTISYCEFNDELPQGPTGKKGPSTLRLHDGQGYFVNNSIFRGNVGCGPLGQLDGGCRWGLVRWVRKNGSWYDVPKLSSEPRGKDGDIAWQTRASVLVKTQKDIDYVATAKLRADALALRVSDVRFVNCYITGAFIAVAGASSIKVIGGKIENPAGGIFDGSTSVYPNDPWWIMAGDVVRPRPEVVLSKVDLKGVQNRPSTFIIES